MPSTHATESSLFWKGTVLFRILEVLEGYSIKSRILEVLERYSIIQPLKERGGKNEEEKIFIWCNDKVSGSIRHFFRKKVRFPLRLGLR